MSPKRNIVGLATAIVMVVSLSIGTVPNANAKAAWSLSAAAAPYKGTTIHLPFLDRPGYKAAIAMIPAFTKATGIKVTWDIIPYESTLQKLTLDFTGGKAAYDGVLSDVVWIGNFGASGWMVPLSKFMKDPKLADPALNIKGFFPILLDSFGTWNKVVYGLPFDNYAGVMFYNKCMLKDAGFTTPPTTYADILSKYGPALTKNGKYAYELQSARGETQSADSFMRMIWAGGGSLLDSNFKSNLSSAKSIAGLQLRQDLMKYMPASVVADDHSEVVNAFAQGKVAMITEWSAFNATITDQKTSKVTPACLGYALEPAGPVGKPMPALGGFSLGVSTKTTATKQAATWLFIQWITSQANAKTYIKNGGVSGRMAVYKDPTVATNKLFGPMVESWQKYGNPVFRPRFPEWPAMSEEIAAVGTDMQSGNISIKDGAAKLDAAINKILADAGYASGKKPKLQ
jgi:multiple sugar transport system substrate-binding protein